MKVLVTGASGFLGRNALLKFPTDWDITALYCRDNTFIDFLKEYKLNSVKPLLVDLKQSCADIVTLHQEYDACLYLAANGDPAYSQINPQHDLEANTLALINLLSVCHIKHFIYFSSGAVYDGLTGLVNPTNTLAPLLPYAISKWAAERYTMHAQKYGRIESATIVRFFGAYGPFEANRKIYNLLIKQFAFDRNPKFTIRGDGKNYIDAMYIDDTIDAILKILTLSDNKNTIVDLYSGTPLSLTALVTKTANFFGLEADIQYIDIVPEYIQFRSNDTLMTTKYQFKPKVSLDEGLTKFYEFLSRNKIEIQQKAC